MNGPAFIELRPGAFADCTGALYLEESRALLLADLHLGYAWAQRRRGELGPITDGGVREKLGEALRRWRPEQVVFVGDLVHLGKPAEAERAFIEELIAEVVAQAQVTAVLGNHDRHFVRDFGHLGLLCTEQWEDRRVIAVHGDRAWPVSEKLLVMGHLHPALGLEDAVGVTRRLPAFVCGSSALVMPAFSPFAAGFDLRKPLVPAWRSLFGDAPVELAALTGTQIRRLPRRFALRYQSAGQRDAGP